MEDALFIHLTSAKKMAYNLLNELWGEGGGTESDFHDLQRMISSIDMALFSLKSLQFDFESEEDMTVDPSSEEDDVKTKKYKTKRPPTKTKTKIALRSTKRPNKKAKRGRPKTKNPKILLDHWHPVPYHLPHPYYLPPYHLPHLPHLY